MEARRGGRESQAATWAGAGLLTQEKLCAEGGVMYRDVNELTSSMRVSWLVPGSPVGSDASRVCPARWP